MLLLRWVFKYVDFARQDSGDHGANDLAQPISPEGWQVIVVNGKDHLPAAGLGRVCTGAKGQIGKFAANGPIDRSNVRGATHEQARLLSRFRERVENVVA